MAETIDVSGTGSKIRLSRRVRHRTVVRLSLPLPFELRSHSGLDPDYSVYALVRRVDPPRDGRRIVALEFLGEKPPQGFSERPWDTFRTEWAGAERRRQPRVEKSELVAIEYLDEALQPIGHDDAVTENVSPRGVRIILSTPAPEFDLVKIIRVGEKKETVAVASDRYFGEDGVERICLRFIGSMPGSALIAEHRAERARANGMRILIADDDPPLRKVLGKILTDAGYDVLFAEDGQSAVEKAASERPDLVIADGLMPKIHGFLACKTIKQMQSPPKVILLTAVYTKRNYKWEARGQYGADDLLTKPFELSKLLACIEKHLADRALESPAMKRS
jgi:CheY-like chemotaxis protein